MNTPEIENILRHAPQPAPPPGLKEQLKAQAPIRGAGPQPQRSVSPRGSGSWLARWWPALAPAAVSLACAAVFTVQHMQIQNLKVALQAPVPAVVQAESPAGSTATPDAPEVAPQSGQEQAEIARLRALADKLTTEISRLEQIGAENKSLRAQLAAASGGAFTPEETQALQAARDKALAMQCVNNLKQLALAVRIWQVDNRGLAPTDLLQMSGEMSTPKLLVCPADPAHQPASDWGSYSAANCSYEYLTPGVKHGEAEPDRIMFRCPIHGNIALTDGSVQMEVAKSHPEWIVQRDGKVYFRRSDASPAGGNSGQ